MFICILSEFILQTAFDINFSYKMLKFDIDHNLFNEIISGYSKLSQTKKKLDVKEHNIITTQKT